MSTHPKTAVVPKKYEGVVPATSWWTEKYVQQDRAAFDARAALEAQRMSGQARVLKEQP